MGYCTRLEAQALIGHALKIRDDSVDAAFPSLELPTPLAGNVQDVASKLLNDVEMQITGYDTGILVEKLRRRELSAEAVTRAFLKRAAIAQKTVFSTPRPLFVYLLTRDRSTASRNCCQTMPLNVQNIWTRSLPRLGLSMGSQSPSKSSSASRARSTTTALSPTAPACKSHIVP